ncbi:hypothetical protein [Tenacibaculum haliotis]|uniref:hypothetical protein n=1 Tax=Tenacibaculum haliotis TaxID=1888914 RepID=UPI0021AFF167|nr:hypothetical protein [Tenacibaculum haliotis]MCT4699975.1 hypothetical protein [Tenacibaculum haliotis]
MLKKIGFTILIILGIVFTVGYFRYNPTVNITNTIPAYADAVIRVNLREIEYNILKDVVRHPFLYFKSNEKTTKNQEKPKNKISLFDAIEIPADVFFYTNERNLKDTWVSSALKLKSKNNLQAFFKQEKIVKKNTQQKVVYFTYKQRIFFIINNEVRLLFSFKKIKNIADKLSFISQEKGCLSTSDKIIDNIKKSTNIIAIATSKGVFFELGINGKTVVVNGELAEKNSLFLPYKAKSSATSLVQASGKINKHFLFDFLGEKQKDNLKKLTTLSLDSIRNKWNGEFDLDLASFINKKDTIVTYEYDDDFNKVAKTTIQENVIPKGSFRIGGATFSEYLYSKEAIKNIETDSLLVLNPFFKTYVSKQKNSLFLYSTKDKITSNFKQDEKHKFSFFFNAEKYFETEKGTYHTANKYLLPIKTINAFVTSTNKMVVKINFKESFQSYMYQLLRESNTKQKQ